MDKVKRWWESRTHWFNLTLGMGLVGNALTYVNEIGLEPRTAAIVGLSLSAVQTVGNFYLRSITNTGIGKQEPTEFTGE